MKELEEIMKGKIKLKHFNIDNDTISFQTELDNYTWNLTPRDIEIIIYNLQEEIERLKGELELYENGVYYSSENDKLEREIERLHSIIKEVREHIHLAQTYGKKKYLYINGDDVLEILDKVEENK